MDRATFEREEARNRSAWEALRDQLRREYPGHWVGIACGRLIAASTNYDEVWAALTQLQPPPEYFLLHPVEEEPIYDVVDDLMELS